MQKHTCICTCTQLSKIISFQWVRRNVRLGIIFIFKILPDAALFVNTRVVLALFVSLADARTAHSAGFKTCIVVRETSDPAIEDQLTDCNVIYSLEELWDEYSGRDVPLKRLHPDYYGDYSTDGATNDSEVVTGGEEGPDEQYGHSYVEPREGEGEEENGDSQDA